MKTPLTKYINFFKAIKQAFGQYRYQIAFLTVFAFLSGIFEGIGINALVPLLSLVFETEYTSPDRITAIIIAVFSWFNLSVTLFNLLALIVILFICKSIVLLLFQYTSISIVSHYERNTRLQVFTQTLQSKWSYLVDQKIGHLETVILTDVRQSTVLLQTIIQAIMRISIALVYAIVAFNINPKMTGITVLVGITLAYVFKPLLYKTKKISTSIVVLNKSIAHIVNQTVTGMKTIKTLTHPDPVAKNADREFDELRKNKVKLTISRYIAVMLIEPSAIIFIAVILLYAYKQPTFILSSFLVVMYLVYKLFGYTKQIQGTIYKLTTMFPYLQAQQSYQEQIKNEQEIYKGGKKMKFTESLSLNNVTFSYPNREEKILNNLSLTIKKGEMMGIVGPSGGGKTTFVDLILRLLSTQDGDITVDKTSIKDIDISDWRNKIGYVSQEVFLLNDTIENNIRFFDNKISKEDIEKSIDQADMREFVQSQKKGKKTIVGERGLRLSAGQRQRIHIARVLARNPEVLILDEATSALDNTTEKHIQKVIDSFKGKMTIIVIAHRLSTVMNCDRLLVLDKGKITEQGSPKQLLDDKESYFYKQYNTIE